MSPKSRVIVPTSRYQRVGTKQNPRRWKSFFWLNLLFILLVAGVLLRSVTAAMQHRKQQQKAVAEEKTDLPVETHEAFTKKWMENLTERCQKFGGQIVTEQDKQGVTLTLRCEVDGMIVEDFQKVTPP